MSGGVDTTFLAAFAVGFISFVSPCVLPLVPGYLSAVSGVTPNEMRDGAHGRWTVLGPALIFCVAFTLVFVALGMTATGLGSTLSDHRRALERIAGGVIVALGVLFLASPLVPRLNREWRVDALMERAGSGGPLLAGAAFAIAWTPCVGPTLGTILSAASLQETVGRGAILLTVYSLGLAVPFLLCAVAFNRATTAFRWLRDHYALVNVVSGVVLVAMGLLLLSGQLTHLNLEAQRLLQSIGLDALYDA